MRIKASATAFVLVGSLVGMGCDNGSGDDGMSGGSGGDRATTILGLTSDVSAGSDVYENAGCAVDACHGADGMGSTPLGDRVPNLSDADIVNVLLNGQGGMPPQASRTDQELADVTAYLQDTFQ